MDAEIGSLFKKKFQFRQKLQNQRFSCKFPFENNSWNVFELDVLKQNLNATKQLLNNLEAETWHKHTAFTNNAGAVYQKVKNEINPELLTQAWLKLYECLSQYNLLGDAPGSSNSLQTIHLCEAPGAFISSLNHYLKLKHPNIKFNWLATTFNPYYEGNSLKNMVCDDRFIMHTFQNWHFGYNDTGDIMEWCNIEAILELKLPSVLFVTADGSIDCSDSPAEQESKLARLHWCETVAALFLLSHGGSFVLKMFTLFEHSSVSLLYVLFLSFEELHVFKPCTSKEGNSEVYILAIRYNKSEEIDYLARLIWFHVYDRNVDVTSKNLFSLSEIPETFLSDVINCSRTFKEHQEKAILRNLTLYNMPQEERKLEVFKNKVANFFLKTYCLKRISSKSRISKYQKMKISFPDLGRNWLIIPHSYTHEQISNVKTQLIKFSNLLQQSKTLEWINEEKNSWCNNLQCVYGKPYERVRSTKFCPVMLFRLFEQQLTIEKNTHPGHPFVEMLMLEKQNFLLNNFLNTFSNGAEGENFEFRNIPVLSRFSVSTIWVLSLMFSKIEYCGEGDVRIRFVGYKKNVEILKWLREFDHKALSFVRYTKLFDDSFFNLVLQYNSTLLLKYCFTKIEPIS